MTQVDPATGLVVGSIVAKIQQNYPQFANLLQLPGFAPVLFQAADQGWTPGQVQAAIENTQYWKTTTAQERSWDLLQITDPASAQRAYNQGAAHVWDVLDQLGVDNLNVKQVQPLVDWAVRDGWDDRTIIGGAISLMNGKPPPNTGNMGAAMAAVKGAANDYGQTVSPSTAFQYAGQIAEGKMTQQTIENLYRQYAINQYGQNNPNLADALNRGQTLRQYADPYVQAASQMLAISPDQIDLSQPKWNTFLQPDAQTGQPMNITQWQQKIRQDPTYGWDNTQDARDSYTKASTQILQTFGALG